MKQREYSIIIHSITRFIIAMVVILCSSLILIDKYTPRIENEFISIIQFIAIFVSSFYLAHMIGMAKAKVLFTDEGYIHIWERRFFLSSEKTIKISWYEIDSYVFQKDRTFDSLIFNLTTKRRYKINRLNILPINDDFKKLLKDFTRLENEFREGQISNSKVTINEGETIYASKAFKWIFYFMLGGFVILLTGKIINSESGSTWSSLGVIGSAILFYGTMILRKRNN